MPVPLTDQEVTELVDAFSRPPYDHTPAWAFDYEYPGFFVYRHYNGKRVYFTPDFDTPGWISIQIVQAGEDEPSVFTGVQYRRPLTAERLWELVRPYLRAGRDRRTRRPQQPPARGRKDWDPRD